MINNTKLTCPKCFTSENVIPILYGFPEGEYIEKAKKGEIHIGGCLLDPVNPDPTHLCKSCWVKFDEAGRTSPVGEDERLWFLKGNAV